MKTFNKARQSCSATLHWTQLKLRLCWRRYEYFMRAIVVTILLLTLNIKGYAFTLLTVPELMEGALIEEAGFKVEISGSKNCNRKYLRRISEEGHVGEYRDSPPNGYSEIFIGIPKEIEEDTFHYTDFMYIKGNSSLISVELKPRMYNLKDKKVHGVKICALRKNFKHLRVIVGYSQYFPSEGRSYNTKIFHLEGFNQLL
jgi:hypothetical protein